MTDIELLPLPPLHIAPSVEPVDYPNVAQALMDYARANVAHATAAKDAEIEALRVRADAMAGEAIKHEARAERLAEAVKAKLHDWYARDRLDESDAQWMREKTYEQCADELTALLRGQEEGT